MDEFAIPARYVAPPEATLSDDPFDNAERWPDHVGFSRKVRGHWQDVTCREFADQVAALAGGLMRSGVEVGDRVALMAPTSYEWMLCDYAIWTAGAVTVPIYETSSAEQVEWYVGDSGATDIIVATGAMAETVGQVRERLPAVRHVWRIDAGNLSDLSEVGAAVPRAEVELRRRMVGADTLATIVYTSGTTGRPKGCEITHGNLLASVRNASLADGVHEKVFNETRSTLLFIPLAHILARVIQISAVHNRVRLGHLGDPSQVVEELAEFRPTVVLSVPRVFEKLYNTAEHKAEVEGHGRLFHEATATAIAYSSAFDTGGPSLLLRLRHAVFDRLVYRKVRAAMGGAVEYAVSGGAPLGERLGHYFRGVGITVLEGYGLTETCAGVTLNVPDALKVGSVGRPIPSVAVRIAEDGEVLLHGPQVFVGYRHNETATKEVLDEDGWFSTGDIGALDQEGYLFITGRKKDLIVTAAGKNVAPAVLEDRVRSHWLVSQCLVVGDAKPYVGALVTIDVAAFSAWKGEHGKPESAGVVDLREDPDLLAALQEAVDDANAAVSRAEAIKRIRVLSVDFTEEAGHITPTQKLKRNVVMADFADDVAALYAPAQPRPTPR